MSDSKWPKVLFWVVILNILTFLFVMAPGVGCAPKPIPPSPAPLPAAKPITLHLATYLPPTEPGLMVWMEFFKQLETATNGMVKTEFHTTGAMGKSSEHYQLALKGVADIIYAGLPHTPGVFPMMQLFELPISVYGAETYTRAMIQMYKRGYLDKDFAQVKVLGFGAISGIYGSFWTKNPARTVAEFRGKKIRTPGTGWTEALNALGTTPVTAAASDSHIMLQKEIIDGDMTAFNALKTFNLIEIVKYVTELKLAPFQFGILMNKDSWGKLPPGAKDFINKNWEGNCYKATNTFDKIEAQCRDEFLKGGGEVIYLSPAEKEKLAQLYAPIWDKFIAEREAKGLPAKKFVDELYSVLKGLGEEQPFTGYKPKQ